VFDRERANVIGYDPFGQAVIRGETGVREARPASLTYPAFPPAFPFPPALPFPFPFSPSGRFRAQPPRVPAGA